jgi:Fic family protein
VKRAKSGRYATISTVGEKVKAFIPDTLPPCPALNTTGRVQDLIDNALVALGRLDSVSILLPDTSLFLYMYVRKEAVLSSQIEGTQSSLSDLLLFENDAVPGVPLDDVQESSNYVAAMYHGLKLIRDGLPFSVRLVKEIHKVLLAKGRGSDKTPGQFRRSQNWIGGTRPGNALFVPPPPDKVAQCMSDLEKFIHDKNQGTPVLIKCALLHGQFETIHPFLDGNGRVGRLLITLLLCAERILKEPMLYPSLYFKTHRDQYYNLLQKIRTDGDWEGWVEFFADAVKETAESAVKSANQLMKVADQDREKIRTIGRAAGSALRVHQALLQKPVISIPKACQLSGLWATTVTMVMEQLEKLGIVKEITGGRRNRLYNYVSYMKILNKGMEE